MLTSAQIKDLLRDSLVRLNEEKAEGQKIPISDATVLLGTGTLLDSLDFVAIVTDIEDQLHALAGQAIPLGTDMQAFDDDNPFRTVATLEKHIEMGRQFHRYRLQEHSLAASEIAPEKAGTLSLPVSFFSRESVEVKQRPSPSVSKFPPSSFRGERRHRIFTP